MGRTKRKNRGSSSSDDSFVEKKTVDKKQKQGLLEDMSEEETVTISGTGDKLDMEALRAFRAEFKADMLTLINEHLGALAKKSDIIAFRADVDKLFASLSVKIDKAESRLYDIEKRQDSFQNELAAVKQENAEIRDTMIQQTFEIRELEQYGRRNNVKVYGLKEERVGDKGETAEETVENVCKLFTNKLGVTVTNRDVAMAHRLGGKRDGKERSVIVPKNIKK